MKIREDLPSCTVEMATRTMTQKVDKRDVKETISTVKILGKVTKKFCITLVKPALTFKINNK